MIQGGCTRLAIYRRLLGAQVRGQASYRASFVLDLVGQRGRADHRRDRRSLAVFRVTRTLGGFTVRRGAGDVRPLGHRVRAGRPRGRQHREDPRVRAARACSTRCWSARCRCSGSCWRWTSRTRRMTRIAARYRGARRRVRPRRRRLDPGPGRGRWCWHRCRGAVFFASVFVGDGHGRVLVDRLGRVRQRLHVRRSRLHLVPDHCLQWTVPAAVRVLARASPSSPTTRRWRCSAGPTRSGCRAGSPGPARWCRGRGGAGGRPGMAVRRAALPEHRVMTGASVIEARGLRKEFTVTTQGGPAAPRPPHGRRGRRRRPASSSGARCSATSARTAPASRPP